MVSLMKMYMALLSTKFWSDFYVFNYEYNHPEPTHFFTATNDHCRHLGFELFSMTKIHVWLHVDVVHARWLSVIMLIDDLHVVLSYRMPHFHIAILYDGKRETWCGLSVFLYFISNAVNPVCAELFGGNIMIYLHFLSFLDDEMLTEGRGLFIRPNQYYGCKWMTTQGTRAWATMELT